MKPYNLIDKHFLKSYRVMKMRKIPSMILLATTIFVLPVNSTHAAESDIMREIKNLREDMNKRFEQVDKRFEQVDKRFEQVDKRFESVQAQMDGRFNQMMWFFGLWIPVSMAIIGYIFQRISKHDDRIFQISGNNNDIHLEKFIASVQKADPQTRKRLKEVLKG